ncbi:septum formation initiator family protein [Desulfonispora thiosulfatigenes]|nr:septum formation initiator family protein [Desulfonispora thiosulfatigenes]
MANKKAVGTNYVPEYEVHPKTRNHKAPKKKNKKNKSKIWLVKVTPHVSLISIFFLVCFSFVAQNVWLNGLGHDVTNLKQEIEDLKENNEKLKLNIASLTSLEKVEQSAAKIGMIYPDTNNYIYVEKNNKKEIENNMKFPTNINEEEGFIKNVQSFISNSFNKVD